MTTNTHETELMSDRRLTEFNYHRKLNTWMVFFALPFFLFFSIFLYFRGSHLQSLIYCVISITAVVTQSLAYWHKEVKAWILIKQVGSVITFGLLAASLLIAISSDDFFIGFPWVFTFSVIALLFFGEHIGLIFAILFTLTAVIFILDIDWPWLTDEGSRMLKLNSALVLATMLGVGLISNNVRVSMRNKLLDALHKYKAAEERQRRMNAALKIEIEMRMQSERALAQSEARYRALFEESAVSLWEEDYSKVKRYMDDLPEEAIDDLEAYFLDNPDEARKCFGLRWVTDVNRATLALYEADSKSTLLKNIWNILPSDLEKYITERLLSLFRNVRYEAQVTAQTLKGRRLHLLLGSTIPAGYEESWEKVYTSVYNNTERVAMEEERKHVDRQLQQTRQIQAIAALAGGIAHQFNNALAAIWGNLDLLERKIQGPDKYKHNFGALRTASEHMRLLTARLLAYARGGKYQPRNFCLNELICDLLRTNKIARGLTHKVKARLEGEVVVAKGDITQIAMVLEAVLNNAAEAMINGGEINIVACNQRIGDRPMGSEAPLPSGNYAVITVEDQGIGMDEETRQRIFEPFFTTKFVGRGLGMAAAHGIVRNHNGMIEVHSAPGTGTQVTIYFPGMGNPEDHAWRAPEDPGSTSIPST